MGFALLLIFVLLLVLAVQLTALRRDLAAWKARVAALETQLAARRGPSPGAAGPAQPAVPPPVPPAASEPPLLVTPLLPTTSSERRPTAPTGGTVGPASVARVAAPAPPPAGPRDFEQFVGGKLFAWIGGFAGFLAVAFFVKYSFEHELIPPAVRIAIGFGLGAALVAAGLAIRSARLRITAQVLSATGIVSLYAVTYTSHAVYHFAFFTPVATFAVMALVTAAAVLLAVRREAQVVAWLGVLGGFLTPVLVSTGQDNPTALFGYIALLDAGLIAVALHRRWSHLVPLAGAGTVLLHLGWMHAFFTPHRALLAESLCLAFAALFGLAAELSRRWHRPSVAITGTAVALPLVALGYAAYFLTVPEVSQRVGPWLPFVLAADGLLLVLAWRDDLAVRLDALAGALVFALLAGWFAQQTTPLTAALAATGGFSVLHTVFPLLRQRRTGWAGTVGRSSGVVPAFAVLLPFALLVWLNQRHGLPDPAPFFGLAVALVLLAFAVTALPGSPWLPVWALAGVAALAYAWHARNFTVGAAGHALLWYLGFHALFAGYPFVFRRRFGRLTGPWAAAALSGVVLFPLVYRLVRTAWPGFPPGWLPVLFALPPFLSWRLVRRAAAPDPAAQLDQIAWFAAVSLAFATLVFPVQFERQWLTLGWALEGVALLWLFRRVPHPGLRATGVVLLVIAFARLALNPAVLTYHPRAATAIFNWYLYAYGVVTAALFAGARLLNPSPTATPVRVAGVPAPPLLHALAAVLAFLLLNIEIADFFSPPGATLTFAFSGSFARDMTYTVSWALYALVVLGAGVWRRQRGARFAAIGLLGVAVLKLFFHDLAELGQLYRVGALVGVAVVAIVASWLYQRFVAAEPPDAGPQEPGR